MYFITSQPLMVNKLSLLCLNINVKLLNIFQFLKGDILGNQKNLKSRMVVLPELYILSLVRSLSIDTATKYTLNT